MKKLNIFLSLLIVLLFYSSLIFAQQDYEIVQGFKTDYQQVKQDIKSADSLAQLDQIENQINDLANKYSPNKELLDKSLYPDDFNSSLEKLRNELSVKRTDLTKITVLKNQVADLLIQIDTLNARNAVMMEQVKQLVEQSKIDRNKIAQLERTVYSLRVSLRKRDDLVMTMLDSLIPAGYRGNSLSAKEKQNVFSKAQKTNIIDNIQKAIDDNIAFLEATTLNPNDIDAIKKKQQDFENTWKNVGPRIISIYSERRQSTKNIQKIDSSFTRWHRAIDQEVWNSVREDFNGYGIMLNKFSNSREFTQTVSSYINDQINQTKLKGDEAENDYKNFADKAWYGDVKPKWVTYLTDNNMMTTTQKDTIEARISLWKDTVYPGTAAWLYIVIIILALIVLVFFFRKKSSSKGNNIQAQQN